MPFGVALNVLLRTSGSHFNWKQASQLAKDNWTGVEKPYWCPKHCCVSKGLIMIMVVKITYQPHCSMVYTSLLPIDSQSFLPKMLYWAFWRSAQIYSKSHLQHNSMYFFLLASYFTTFLCGYEQKSKLWDF